MTKTTIQISSISTWQKSGRLFRYPLFLPDTKLGLSLKYHMFRPCLLPRLLFWYPLFLLAKNLDYCSDIHYFWLTPNQDRFSDIHYFSRPKTKTTAQISSISTWEKLGFLFRHPLFLHDLRPRLLFKYPLFLLVKNLNCYSNILCFYPAYDQDCYSIILCFELAKIRNAM